RPGRVPAHAGRVPHGCGDRCGGPGSPRSLQSPASDAGRRPVNAKSRPSPATPPDVAGTVLVVEDDDETLSVLSRTLAAGGFEVLWARDRSDVRKLLDRRGRTIQLVVCDVVLPGSTAVEVVNDVAA